MAYTQQTPIGTPDVNLITKTLASLQPDSALQQYAMLHKNNPYILSLAKSESDRRKSLRTAAQGQVGQQPTVADQSIAGMAPAPMMAQQQLPENQGIAQIPAPNIQSMADGGIAGYGDGDDVPRQNGMAQGGMYDFAQRSEPVVRMSGGGAVQKFAGKGESLVRTTDGGKTWFLDIPKTIRDPSVPYYRLIPNPAARLADMKFPSKAAALEAATTASTKFSSAPGAEPYSTVLGAALPTVSNTFYEKDGTQSTRLANKPVSELAADRERFGKTEQTATFQGPDYPIVPRFQPGVSDAFVPPAAATTSAAVAPPGAVPPGAVPPGAVPPGAAPAAAVPPAAPAPQAALPTGIATIKQPTAEDATAASNKFFDADALTRRLDQQRMQERQDIAGQKETRLAQLDAFNKEKGPAFAGYEKLLQKEELQDATDKEKSGLMSLMKGFLAMAAGESPNAATNIAKGAMVGLGDYGDALKEFKKAAKERTKAMADIENARRAEGRDDFKSQQMYEEKADTRMAESDRAFTNAVTQITGKKGEIASGIYKDLVNNAEATKRLMYSEAAQTARTNATLAAPDAQTKFYSGIGGGDPKKGLEFYSSVMGPESKGLQGLLAKYADPMKLELLKTTDPDLYNFVKTQLRMQLQPQPTGKPTGPVRE
jgi:hypothetical protein